MTRIAVSRSVCPDTTMRTVSGYCAWAWVNSAAPSMPGMRMSDTIASNGWVAKSSSACSPLSASVTCHPSPNLRNDRLNADKIRASSSTNITLGMLDVPLCMNTGGGPTK